MPAGSDWSGAEIDGIVADYFAMLADELARRSFSKAEHNRVLQGQIDRGRGSIEFKHQNISAVMLGLGQPWINGYKPAANFQNALVDGVLRWLNQHPGWLAPKAGRAGQSAVADSAARLWIGPPPAQRNEPPPVDPAFIAAIGRKYDVAERDARNRALGQAGEELVLAHERQQLAAAGRDDLARKVRWTAQEDGDGYGYDIASFLPDGRERLVEVKTTNGWERTPFHISRNEVAVAEARRDDWHLVRLYDFARTPKAFSLRPPLEAHAELTATSFLAALR
ncbi:hypothetical protein PK98_15285 [Croceibacterium mercuriale]|uniref:Protein NO VEIN C-terminal domain-containing protein n=1 Tax=Croceibacterium mercuriale TaxID=1572751 RepID=A0A0B2BVZ8_9SPHN|nr:DUF3883 domain-containing protein [Croceibacterium mercuriale]KHL24139.1 hypothetical protein PK98_15285 [Croceibacterium mercuriale]